MNDFPRASIATWIHSLPLGKLQVTLPLPVSADDVDDIEKLFALVMRRILRDLIPPDPQTATEVSQAHAGSNSGRNEVSEAAKEGERDAEQAADSFVWGRREQCCNADRDAGS